MEPTQLDRIEALLERIADAVAPTPEQTAERQAAEYQALRSAWEALGPRNISVFNNGSKSFVNAIAGETPHRGVRR